jgi:hypothetical protein
VVIDLVILQSAAAMVVAADTADRPGWSIVRSGADCEHELRLPLRRLATSSLGIPPEPHYIDQDAPPAIPSAGRTSVPAPARGSEWQVGAGYAWSIDLLQSEGGRRYIPWTVSWGRDLMADAGPGVLRGRLMWAVEAMPLYWQYQPTDTAGVGVSPLVWRWRFVPRSRAAAFAELAFGGVFTGDPVPEGTESANFLTHGAFGVKWRPADRTTFITAYRFQHISNGNQLATNPGVNAHVLWIGVSVAR